MDVRLTTGLDCLQLPPSNQLVAVQLVGFRLLEVVVEIYSQEQLPNVVVEAPPECLVEAFWLRRMEVVDSKRRRAATSMHPH